MKIGMELPFTLRTNAEIQIWNLTFKKYHFGPPKKCIFGFWRKPSKNVFSSCFGFDSALKTIDAQMFFWIVFLKTHKKSYRQSKTPLWTFLAVNNGFLWVFQKYWLNNICASIVFKAESDSALCITPQSQTAQNQESD